MLKQQPVGQLQEQIEATKIQASKTKHVKLNIRECYRNKMTKEVQYKIYKGENTNLEDNTWPFKSERRKSLNRKNRQRKVI